jgi:hypothetical protein
LRWWWNARLTTRIGHAEDRQATSAEVLTAVSQPAARVMPLRAEGVPVSGSEAPAQLAAAVIPGWRVLYLFGSMPAPPAGRAYTVWLKAGGRYVDVATFVPEKGGVLLALRVDPEGYERLLITEEEDPAPRSPSGPHVVEVAL